MSQTELEATRRIFYHPEIISFEHRKDCNVCDMAYFLIKDIIKVSSEENNI